ncbi:guanitoxin biosynthesis L-enduracididine beta-hydroxylase GntD [Streptomyces ovatisporus]|uniref:Guanitoxin biosynthesis L-enduracididine beta-hydroxylase GntD n=1 Tax=Streptomyces ovatisporus TaxID=1128682 RepID=A0ABV9A804_9ACTN
MYGALTTDTAVETFTLTPSEAARVRRFVAETAARHGSPGSAGFLQAVQPLGAQLPPRLTDRLHAMRRLESTPALVVRGYGQGPEPGPTPGDWRRTDPRATALEDFRLLLLASQLGDPFSWSSLQEGRLVTDILPVPGKETEQTGQSSDVDLEFHVEDAFHPHRCDYLALLCLRNPQAVATTLATADCAGLPDRIVDVLFEERFLIEPDLEHSRNLRASADGTPAPWGRPVSVLFGDRTAPYLRLDPPYMTAVPGDGAAAEALEALCRQLAGDLREVVLEQGDILLVDNYRAVHGRRPFVPRYDGTDRWLRRVFITRDLRRTRGLRSGAADHVVRQ